MPTAAPITVSEIQRATYYAALILKGYGPLLDDSERIIAEQIVLEARFNGDLVSDEVALAVVVGLRTGIICGIADGRDQG